MAASKKGAPELLAALGGAASGLLFPSESDYPLTPIEWRGPAGEELSPEVLLRSRGLPPDTRIEGVGVDEFFEPLTGQDGGDDAAKFRRLTDLMKRELTDVRAYRVGAVDIDVFILGRHPSGAWIGLKTKVIET